MRVIIATSLLALAIVSCGIFSPGSPTRQALEAGTSQVAEDLDTNQDGTVSASELAAGAADSWFSRNWEYLAWIGVYVLGAFTPAAAKRVKKTAQCPLPWRPSKDVQDGKSAPEDAPGATETGSQV